MHLQSHLIKAMFVVGVVSSSVACGLPAEAEPTAATDQALTFPPPPGTVEIEVTPTLGWPHEIRSAVAIDCSSEPLGRQVIVYRSSGFTGSCALLTPGFYPTHASLGESLGVGGDQIGSIKVGPSARARVFQHDTYGGEWMTLAGGTRASSLGWFDDRISSMRVEPNGRSASCDDVKEGEIALYEDSNFSGDCVVLPGAIGGVHTFAPNAAAMGIQNDSISSIRNNTYLSIRLFRDPSYSGIPDYGAEVFQHSAKAFLPGDHLSFTGVNDEVSSFWME